MFPSTRVSVLASIRSPDAEQRARALDALTRAYWRPVYTYVRLRWRALPEDAEDLTQEFFARALAGETFARYDAREARFRTFLRLCLDGFVVNQRKAASRLKRGGEYRFVSLDFAVAEGEIRQHEPGSSMD